MNIGERYSLRWQHSHRVEATILELQGTYLVAEVEHRCPITCELQQMRGTLPIEGRLRYRYGEFARLFVPMCDAPALPGGVK